MDDSTKTSPAASAATTVMAPPQALLRCEMRAASATG
jgi:hypothetical protein